MKMFYIKPEMDVELVEVEAFLAQSEEVVIEPGVPGVMDAPEFTWE